MTVRMLAAAFRVTAIAIIATALLASACGGDVTVGRFSDGGADGADATSD